MTQCITRVNSARTSTPYQNLSPPFEVPTLHSGTIFEPIHSRLIRKLQDNSILQTQSAHVSLPNAITTVSKMQHFAVSIYVLVIIAHDASLWDVLPFYPKSELTGWEKREMEDNLKAVGASRFLKDFGKAIDCWRQKGSRV